MAGADRWVANGVRMVESHGGARKYQDLTSGTHSLEQREEEQRDSSAIMHKQDWGKELQLYYSNLLNAERKGGNPKMLAFSMANCSLILTTNLS